MHHWASMMLYERHLLPVRVLVPVCSRQRSDIILIPQLAAYKETLSVREHEKTIKKPRQLLLWDMKHNCCEHHFISLSCPNTSCPLLSVWSACFYIVHIAFCWEALYLYICNQSERQVKINGERKNRKNKILISICVCKDNEILSWQ